MWIHDLRLLDVEKLTCKSWPQKQCIVHLFSQINGNRDVRPQYCRYQYHLLVLWSDSSSLHIVCIAKSSSFTSSVPLSLTRTFLASWENPLLRSQEGLSGSTRHPKNITMDGIAAKPSINLWKEKEKNAKFSDNRIKKEFWREVIVYLPQQDGS